MFQECAELLLALILFLLTPLLFGAKLTFRLVEREVALVQVSLDASSRSLSHCLPFPFSSSQGLVRESVFVLLVTTRLEAFRLLF